MDNDCKENKHAPKTEQTNHNDCDCNGCCSPFFACGNCAGCTIPSTGFALTPQVFLITKQFTAYQQTFYSQFAPSIWQPPKLS